METRHQQLFTSNKKIDLKNTHYNYNYISQFCAAAMLVDIEDISAKIGRVISHEYAVPTQLECEKWCKLVRTLIDNKSHDPNEINQTKRTHGFAGKNSFLLQVCKQHNMFTVEEYDILAYILRTKRGKSHSGVVVITILTSPTPTYINEHNETVTQDFSCTFSCSFCPNDPAMPRSYLSMEPACLRALKNKFDVCAQIWERIDTLRIIGHTTVTKLEIIVEGGTWSSYPKEYRESFCRDIYYAANVYNSEKRERLSLNDEKRINESSKMCVIGLTLETRPDSINHDELRILRSYGCTRVQLGVQHLDQDVLDRNNRRCTTKCVKNAIKMLKNACFKVDIHLMPNLPGSSIKKDRNMLIDRILGMKKPFPTRRGNTETYDLVEPDLQADQFKIYPCAIVPWTDIEKWYRDGTYVPYGNNDLEDLLIEAKSIIFPWIRLNRIVRDIPTDYMISDTHDKPNLRQDLAHIMKTEGKRCRCIRCREVKNAGFASYDIIHREYRSSGGTEFFTSAEKDDVLFGFVRLRLPDGHNADVFYELHHTALIRELHVYGQVEAVGQVNNNVQHRGIGKDLVKNAIKIAKKHGFKKIAVISGEGVKAYYRKLGFVDDGSYLTMQI